MGGRAALILVAVVTGAQAYPFFAWGGPHGGDGADEPLAVATAPSGTVVLAATRGSGPQGALPAPTGTQDIVVMRYDMNGNLEWWRHFAGDGADGGPAGDLVHVGLDGTITLAFTTQSTDLPVLGAVQPTLAGGTDAYLARIADDGTLLSATYFGGAGADEAAGIEVHADRVSLGLTTTSDGLAGRTGFGGQDAFVVSFDVPMNIIVAAGYVGGSDDDRLASISTHPASRELVLAGSTRSVDFPVIDSSMMPAYGGWNGFLTLLGDDNEAYASATFGGSGDDFAHDVEVGSGGILVVGQTGSDDFPLQLPVQEEPGGNGDAFVAVFDHTWVIDVAFMSYLGGQWADSAAAAAWTLDGRAVVVGASLSDDFPTRWPPLPDSGGVDGFIALIDTPSSTLEKGSLIGGCLSDAFVDVGRPSPAAPAFLPVLGFTHSEEVPMQGGMQTASAGGRDLYVLVVAPQGDEGPAAVECEEEIPEGWDDQPIPEGGEGTGEDPPEEEQPPQCQAPCGCDGPCPPPPCGPPIDAPFAERQGPRVRVTWNAPACGTMAVYNGTRLVAEVPSVEGQAFDEVPWDAAHAYLLVWNSTAQAQTNAVPAIGGATIRPPGPGAADPPGPLPTWPAGVDQDDAAPTPDASVGGAPWAMAAVTLGLPLAAVAARWLRR